jgi:hypothetical protein
MQVALSLVTIALIGAVSAAGLFISEEAAIAYNGSLPIAPRARAARRVLRLRPLSASAEITYAILEGRRLFVAGQWDAAHELMNDVYQHHTGSGPLRAELRKVDIAIERRAARPGEAGP